MLRLGARHDQVRPQVGFGEQREVRLPVLDEARRIARRVERDELVDHVGRQALVGEPRRRDGAGGDQHIEIARPDALDQRDDGEHLADACAMRPDQRSGRAGDPRFAAPLGQALRMLLAAREPPREHDARHRRRERGEAAIGAQGPGQPFSHEHLCRSIITRATIGSSVGAPPGTRRHELRPATRRHHGVGSTRLAASRRYPGPADRCRWTMK